LEEYLNAAPAKSRNTLERGDAVTAIDSGEASKILQTCRSLQHLLRAQTVILPPDLQRPGRFSCEAHECLQLSIGDSKDRDLSLRTLSGERVLGGTARKLTSVVRRATLLAASQGVVLEVVVPHGVLEGVEVRHLHVFPGKKVGTGRVFV
jgi:hypothetical protein